MFSFDLVSLEYEIKNDAKSLFINFNKYGIIFFMKNTLANRLLFLVYAPPMSVRSPYSTKKIEKELEWKLTVPVKEGVREFGRDLR